MEGEGFKGLDSRVWVKGLCRKVWFQGLGFKGLGSKVFFFTTAFYVCTT